MKRFKKFPPAGRSKSPSATPGRPSGRIVVGLHAVRELLKVRPRSATQLWLKDGYRSHSDLVDLAEIAARHRVPVQPHSPAALDKIASVHQGIIAFSNESPELNLTELKAKSRATLVVLDEVEDPHNLGAVLRTAWLLGVDGVLTPGTRSAPLSATVSKVAQGAVEHVPVLQDSGLLETLKDLKASGFWLFGLAAEGTSDLFATEVPEKVIWVLGSESSGIRKPIARECDQLVRIPQIDADASFNVSVAAAMALAETFRQRR